MGGLIRILFPLISYFCVATVITLTVGYGYLRSNGTLDNENMFQIVSLLHGIDLEEIAATNETDQQDVPPQEISFKDRQRHTHMTMLHLQAKKDDIEKNITRFKAQATELDNKFRHYEKFRDEVKLYLEKKKKIASASGINAVRKQWEKLDAKKQTKQILTDMVNDGQMDTVIDLLNGMPPKSRDDILKTLVNPEELKLLYDIQQAMLTGGPEAALLDKKLNELKEERN